MTIKRTVSTEESRLEIRPICSLIFSTTSISSILKENLLSSTDKSSIHLEGTQALDLVQLDQTLMEEVVISTHNHRIVQLPKHTLLIKMLMLIRLQLSTLDLQETLGDLKKKEAPLTLQTTIT